MSIDNLLESMLKIKKLRYEEIMFLIIIFFIIMLIDLIVCYINADITIIISKVRWIWYLGFILSIVTLGLKAVGDNIDKKKYFNIMDNLNNEHLEILESFAISNCNIAEIKNNYEFLVNLEQAGFIINCISGLYEGNRRIINGNVYTDTMVKAKLENDNVLPYIKAYFKKKKCFNKTY